jgi:hypothetical protein
MNVFILGEEQPSRVVSKYDTIRRTLQCKVHVSSACEINSSLMSNFGRFYDHCRDIASTIVKEGKTVTASDAIVKRRKMLGLGVMKVNSYNLRELSIMLELFNLVEEHKRNPQNP